MRQGSALASAHGKWAVSPPLALRVSVVKAASKLPRRRETAARRPGCQVYVPARGTLPHTPRLRMTKTTFCAPLSF